MRTEGLGERKLRAEVRRWGLEQLVCHYLVPLMVGAQSTKSHTMERQGQEKKMIQLNRQQILHVNRNYHCLLDIICS